MSDLWAGTSGPHDASIAIVGEAQSVPLTQGYTAYVSPQDYARVSQLKWYVWKARNGSQTYAKHDSKAVGRVYMHVFILGVKTDPYIVVNHIDGNGLNNTRRNLEVVPQSVNARKGKKRRDGTSQFRGVHYRRSALCVLTKCWGVEVTWNYKKMYRGQFESEIEAAKAYNEAILRIFGPDAGFPLNVIPDDK